MKASIIVGLSICLPAMEAYWSFQQKSFSPEVTLESALQQDDDCADSAGGKCSVTMLQRKAQRGADATGTEESGAVAYMDAVDQQFRSNTDDFRQVLSKAWEIFDSKPDSTKESGAKAYMHVLEKQLQLSKVDGMEELQRVIDKAWNSFEKKASSSAEESGAEAYIQQVVLLAEVGGMDKFHDVLVKAWENFDKKPTSMEESGATSFMDAVEQQLKSGTVDGDDEFQHALLQALDDLNKTAKIASEEEDNGVMVYIDAVNQVMAARDTDANDASLVQEEEAEIENQEEEDEEQRSAGNEAGEVIDVED